MKEKVQTTSFYVETLLLIVVFVAIILGLTQIFGLSASESSRSGRLTGAVVLAENAAEAVSAARSPAELLTLLDESGSAALTEGGVTARYNEKLLPDAAGPYEVRIGWEPEGETLPTLVRNRIEIVRDGQSLYTLDTAVYCPAEKGEEAAG